MALIGTRKKTIRKKNRDTVFKARLKRYGLRAAVLVFALWVGTWLYLSDSFTKAGHWTKQQMIVASAEAGFSVENILVEGRAYTDLEVLKAIINVQKGDPLFAFNPGEAQALVERISWVRAAHVERRLPDTIYIGLEERKPLALYQSNKKLTLIDEQGAQITTDRIKRFKDLVIVMGEGAPEEAPTLLSNLVAEPVLFEKARNAKWIDQRRWDLTLEPDIEVKLPEDDLGLALRRLATAQAEDGLLDKDITSIDLRERDRIVVRTRPGAVQEYKAGLKTGGNI